VGSSRVSAEKFRYTCSSYYYNSYFSDELAKQKKKKQYDFEIKPFTYDFLIASLYSALVSGFILIVNNYIGTLIMANLENGMSIMNMSVFWQYIVKG